METITAEIVNFRRGNEKQGVRLCVRLDIRGEKVYHYTNLLTRNEENFWIDWTENNFHNQPKLKVKPGDKVSFVGEIEDNRSSWGGYKILKGEVIK